MYNFIIRHFKIKGFKTSKRIKNILDEIWRNRLKSTLIFLSIIALVIILYLSWYNLLRRGGNQYKEPEDAFVGTHINSLGNNYVANILKAINSAFFNMFSTDSRDNLIAEIYVNNEDASYKKEKQEVFIFTNKTNVKYGEVIIKSGEGFTELGLVTLSIIDPHNNIELIQLSADKDGRFNYNYTVSKASGVYYISAKDNASLSITNRIKYLVLKQGVIDLVSETQEKKWLDNANIETTNKEKLVLSLPKECIFSLENKASIQSVIINEIAWMGSLEHANNEWIELKNISSNPINISGWWLIDKAGQIKIVFPNNTIIQPNRFYLLERGDDNAVPHVLADMIYVGALSNTNEGLKLFNNNCLIQDEVMAENNWLAGESNARQTMERAVSLLKWQTSVFVNGTPKQENSAGLIVKTTDDQAGERTISQNEVDGIERVEEENQSIPICSQVNLLAPSQQIIINEIAWMGTLSSAHDEWIELKNISSNTIDITGWQLLDASGQIKIIFGQKDVRKIINKNIIANEFYLLERTDDSVIANIVADFVYVGTLSNTNESLRLFDASCNLVDEVIASPNWLAGDNTTKQTMERKSDFNWQTSFSPLGTPRSENSAGNASENSEVSGINNANEEVVAVVSALPNTEAIYKEQVVPLRALITEIQISPTSARFIELYNPTDYDIDLTNWYIQRKTATRDSFDSLVSKTHFENKIIAPNSFFIIARENITNAHIVLPTLTLTHSNTIQLKNNNREIIDKIGWGSVLDFENMPFPVNIDAGQSIHRKRQNNIFIDTDNNAEDFKLLMCPTPLDYSRDCLV